MTLAVQPFEGSTLRLLPLHRSIQLDTVAVGIPYRSPPEGVWINSAATHDIVTVPKIEVYPNAPLLDPAGTYVASSSRPESGDGRCAWPLIIFSHGLGGSRSAYR
jgi:hypothetical protein